MQLPIIILLLGIIILAGLGIYLILTFDKKSKCVIALEEWIKEFESFKTQLSQEEPEESCPLPE